MRLPRDLTGAELVRYLAKLGYRKTRQTGSHIRLTCETSYQHYITIPMHDPLRIGTLSAILGDVAEAQKTERDDMLVRLFG